ncbi:MAG: malto-oligosyltrehalose trehalohydrolase [Dongiaceae bacterium]
MSGKAEAKRRLPVGAEPVAGGVAFRVWAPERRRVEVVIEDGSAPRVERLAPEPGGYFAATVAGAAAGQRYRYRLDGEGPLPDPASRFQPEGPHGASEIVDPMAFMWTDARWGGPAPRKAVAYELHVGTFTPEGTWAAAELLLPELARLGITVIEMMPVAEFPGEFGWGYDGVQLFAPTRLYGRPDDLRRFVDRAHALGIAVILDVVYNHLGPDGNYLKSFAPAYFTDRYANEWGEAINFDGPDAGPVRELFLANAAYWVEEFHFDGLRLDATQQIFDASADNIMAAIVRRVRDAAGGRRTLVVGENEPQHARLLRDEAAGGYGLDLLWNDDFHHSAMVALTGRAQAYYSDYRGTPQEFVSAARHGFLFQGQRYHWQKKPRGSPSLDLSPDRLVTFLQNHDQVANSGRGLRIHQLAGAGQLRALTALMILGPGMPMLFQGQEFAASAPFLYFADHHDDLAPLVAEGRRKFLSQFPSLGDPAMQERLPDPEDRATFERCRLDHGECERHREALALHRDLIRLRREDAVLGQVPAGGLDGAVLSQAAFVLRFFGAEGDDRLLLVNLGRDLDLRPAPEPLLAPPEGASWRLLWSSEDPAYGAAGTPPAEGEFGWHLPGNAALVMTAEVPHGDGD